jgi:hypothetical protein
MMGSQGREQEIEAFSKCCEDEAQSEMEKY